MPQHPPGRTTNGSFRRPAHTTCDFDDIEAACGEEVAELVAALSKDKRIREDRRETEYAQQIAVADWRARLIKLADVYDNLCDGAESDGGVNVWQRAVEAVAVSRGDPRLARAVQAVETLLDELAPRRHLLDKRLRESKP